MSPKSAGGRERGERERKKYKDLDLSLTQTVQLRNAAVFVLNAYHPLLLLPNGAGFSTKPLPLATVLV